MDKVKYTLSGSVVNATFTFDDERVPALTVNLNDMSINDGDVLAKQLYAYGQEYKANCIARIPSQAVSGGQGMFQSFLRLLLIQRLLLILKLQSIQNNNLCNMQKFTTAHKLLLANNGTLRKINSTNRWVVQEPFVWYIDYFDHSK